MINNYFVLVGVVALALAEPSSEEKSQAELAAIEGTWKIDSVEAGVIKADPKKQGLQKIVIKEGKLTIYANDKPLETMKNMKLVIDATKTPKHIDLVRREKEYLPCIYEVTKSQLKLAMPLVPSKSKAGELLKRPDNFETADRPVVVIIAAKAEGAP